ncbi:MULTISPECIES: Mur ligase family protein [Luteimonas]|uniref:Mur ligase family protein n=1 Tax=Luteimonas TaxID=83614 RepID=UPI000C79C07B|nr:MULTISPECIES: Mur ligase family protein [Luteimonas]
MSAEPFEESRRLTGTNVYFAGTGAALETAVGVPVAATWLAAWQHRIDAVRTALHWREDAVVVRPHRSGVSLAFAAPSDQLYAATEIAEWAWWSVVLELADADAGAGAAFAHDLPHAPGHADVRDAGTALHTLIRVARAESVPGLLALRDAAAAHGLPFLADDDAVSIGEGTGARVWPADALPEVDAVPWPALHAIPTALVTGSNGKTTTVRLLAAMTRANGWPTAHSCTDGVFFDGAELEAGDFSGPTGARTALRQPQAQAAILETARGGMLRRGLAVQRADVAVVTNISVDHFGEYGIHDLDDLAAVKLTVARAVADDGVLVLNADDPVIARQSRLFDAQRLGWFAGDETHPVLAAHRARGGAICGVAAGRMRLSLDGALHDLGAIADMPLTLGGSAVYNIANAAAAALAASGLGIAPAIIADVLARFGNARGDNPGRLQRWQIGGVEVVVDYAHNPDGLRGLLRAIGADARRGRLGIVVGHAGNREEADLRAVAATAAEFAPERVVLKNAEGYLRGRAPDEIPRIMRDELMRRGMGEHDAVIELDEVDAARHLLAWARAGDLVVAPIFDAAPRARLQVLLDAMQAAGWQAGDPLPPRDENSDDAPGQPT